jgi:hypothetical protein
MARRRSLRSQLYRTARLMGDIEAVSQGPSAMTRRYVRKKTYAKSMGTTSALLRLFKLLK